MYASYLMVNLEFHFKCFTLLAYNWLELTYNSEFEFYIFVCRVGKRQSSLCKLGEALILSHKGVCYCCSAASSGWEQIYHGTGSILHCESMRPVAKCVSAICYPTHDSHWLNWESLNDDLSRFELNKYLPNKSVNLNGNELKLGNFPSRKQPINLPLKPRQLNPIRRYKCRIEQLLDLE